MLYLKRKRYLHYMKLGTFIPKIKQEVLICIIILLLSLILRLFIISSFGAGIWELSNFDTSISGANDQIALSFAEGKTVFFAHIWGAYYIPLGIIYWTLKQLGFIDQRFLVISLLNSFLGTYSVFMVYKISKKIFFDNPKIPLLTMITFSLYYPAIYFTLLNMPENFFTPLIISVFYLYLTKKWNGYKSAIIGLVLGAAIILKTIIFPIIFLLPLWFIRYHKTISTSKLFIFIVALFSVLFISAFINSQIDQNKAFKFSGNSGANAMLAWCQPRSIYYISSEKMTYLFSPVVFQKNKYVSQSFPVSFDNDYYYSKLAVNCLIDHPSRLVTNLAHIKNIFVSSFQPSIIDTPIHFFMLAVWRPITVILLSGFILFPFLYKKKNKFFALGGIFLASICISVYLANPGEERYLIPFYFLLVIFGVPAIYSLITKIISFMKKQKSFYYLKIKKIAAVFLVVDIAVLVVLYLLMTGHLSIGSYQTNPKDDIFEEVSDSYHDAAFWLANNISPYDFSFPYQTDVKSQMVEGGNNIITRQIIGSYGLTLAAKRFRNVDLLKANKHNLHYVKSLVKTDQDFGYIKEKAGPTSINATFFALLNFIDPPQIYSDTTLVNRMGNFILNMQSSDGSFEMLYPKDTNIGLIDEEKYELQRFGSGQAVLACVRLYQFSGDKKYLDCAEKGYNFYSKQILQNSDPIFLAWHILAYSRLYQITENQKYRESVNIMSEKIVNLQIVNSSNSSDIGSFNKDQIWASSGQAVFIEALGYAFRINKESNPEIADRFYTANLLGLKYLISLQVKDGANAKTNGGIQSTKNLPEIVVDNTGHTISAFEEYLSRN